MAPTRGVVLTGVEIKLGGEGRQGSIYFVNPLIVAWQIKKRKRKKKKEIFYHSSLFTVTNMHTFGGKLSLQAK